MPDISKYLKQAEELDKKRGISSNPSVTPTVTPGGTATQTAGPDISAYLAQAEKLDRERSATPTTTPNTTRADGAGVGGNGYEIQMPKLEVELPQIRAFGAADYPAPNLKRIGNVLAAAGTGAAAGFVETAGQMTQPQGLTIGESARVALQGGTRAQEQTAEQYKAQRIRENIKAPLYATADRLTEQSAAYTEKAKEGLGKVGQFAVDLGVTGTQLVGDMALGLINPVLGTGAMATRVFGGSAQEARQAGATETEQQLYGLGSAATSVLVEKIANVGKAFKTAYGGSIAGGKVDDLLAKLTGKLMKNPTGQRILASAAGEAGEEALEALLQPALQAIYDKGATLNKTWFGSTEELTDYLTDVGYNALLGGALGALGGGGNFTAPATTETVQGGAEAAQEGQNAHTAGNETTTPEEGAQRPQNTPMSFENTAAADILLGAAPQKQRAGFTSLENAMANQFERETGISIESVESILGGLANGDYNSANWVARIAQDAKDPKMVVVAHELTHHLQTLAPQEYESFRTAVADYFTRAGGEAALTDMMNRYRSAYGAAGQNLSDSAVMDEMAADFTEVLLTDADLFGQFAQQNRTVAERLLDALRAFIEKIRATLTGRARDAAAQEATGKTLSELEMIAEQWQGVYRAAAAAYGQNANTATQEGDGVRYSFAGINARSANLQQLQTAQEMAARGVENETIRKETGWFRGMDGKWRFEIDDSNMVYRKEGDALFRKKHPEYAEHQALTEKFLFGTITAEEQRRLLELEGIWGRERGRLSERVKNGNAKLRDILQHDALFEAYPQLGNIGVTFADLPNGENASFNRGTNTIEISDRLVNAGESTLLHEIQHAIQKEEGFAKGANPAYWERRINEGYDRRWAGAPLQQMMPSELYRNTAGEIEARDVVERRNLTQQERELRMPNLGDENTVFTENESRWEKATEYDPDTSTIKEQLENSREILNGMNVVVKAQVPENLKNKDDAAKWAANELKKTGYQIDRQNYGKIFFDKNDLDQGLRYADTPEEKAAIVALPYVLKRGIKIGEHDDHKKRTKKTITFAAPVELNGIRGNMAVVVNKHGNSYYAHRIVLPDGSVFKFSEKNNAAQELSQGVAVSSSLAKTTSAASEISVPNLAAGVKGNLSQLKSTAPLRQMMAEMPQQMMIRMPRLTTVEQDEAEAAGVEAAPVEDTVQMPQLGFTDADVPGTEPLTRQDIAREMAWRARMANEPAAPQAMGEVRLPELSADMEEAGMGVADFTGNVETVPQEATVEILSALEDLSRDMEAPMETPTDATVRDAESLISAETVETPQSLKEKAAESWAFFKRKMVDSGEAVTQIGKAINDKYLYPFYNMARASASAGANMIAEEQTDVNGRTVGESLNAIFDPIRAKGEEYYTQFQTYMYDLHNIARMSMDQKAKQEQETAEAALAAYTADHPKFINMTEAQAQRQADSIDELEAEEAQEYLRLVRWVNRAARMGNKPVFDYDFTAEMSRGRSERLLREHPEFAQYREQVRKYIDNMMQYRVDSGLITQQDADFLREYYPDYIPTYRRQAFEDFGAAVKKKRVQIGKTVGRATGGNTKLVPLHEALGKQTMQVVREGSKNRFGARLLQDYTANASNADIARYVRNAEEYESDFSIDTFDSIDDVKPKRGNTFSVYLGGKLYDMTVDNALFEAVEALSPTATEQNTVTKVVHDVNKLYKALITGYNPTFAIRNTVRDLQTAGLYSRDFAAWAKNYPKAMQEIFTNGEMWKQYKALGGDFSSVFDYMTGTVKKPTTKAGKVANKVQWLNMAFEQAPRLAEFMSVMEKGDGSMESAMDAMLAAADVTVNFGRGGTWGKMLNANYVPFLNPGIQGFDKMVRYATQSKNGKQFLMMAARAAALGIAPSLINALLYRDDEEWEDLRDSDKDTNYMFKLKDGLWLKIPKGRELSVLGIAADRVGDAIRGEDVDIRATLNTMANQVAPANPLNQNILKAAYDTQLFDPSSPGRTWYGGDIEGQRLQNYAPGERYDSSTDVVSKAVGGALNLSPKKLNYLADQYTGVVGDIVLPLLTPQAERDMFSKAFTVDSISSNELSSKFYEKSDELTYAKYGGDAVAAVVSRYWNSISSDVSKLYGEIRNVENSDLSNREKKEQVQKLQRQINAIQREALATVDQYTAAVESSLFGDDEDAADFAYRETNREVFGAKSALETYNKDVYAKAQEAAKNGVSYEAYYDYYFATKDIEGDKDASGKTIPGSKREKVLEEINAMDLTVEQKNALYYANGYAESTLYEAPWYTIQMPRL